MSDLNTFNNAPAEELTDAFTAIIWGVLGIAGLFVASAAALMTVGPWLPLVIVYSVFLGSTAVAAASPHWRPIAAGLAFAGFVMMPLTLIGLAGGGVG